MIQFLCLSTACLQQYLGIGFVVLESQNSLVYSRFNRVYYCERSSYSYKCSTDSGGPISRDPFL